MEGSDACHHNRRQAKLTRTWRDAFVVLLLLTSTAFPAYAQNYSFDARRIALGGAGGTPNVASKLVERQRRYKSILIPVGLIKVLSNIRVFYPNREDFDFSRAVEFGTSPFHQVFGRREDITALGFFADIVHARLNPDLNAYRGSDVPFSTFAEGLVSPTWGKTFMLHQDDRSFQGIFAGAGPYLAARAFGNFDSALVDLLNGTGDKYLPAATLAISGGETDQLALSITGGYRARFPMFVQDGAEAGRNGMYVAADYHFLHGLRFDDFDAKLHLETNSAGLLSSTPQALPFTLEWQTSSTGRGMALDFGVTFVRNRWDFGAGVSGVANRINWSKITQHNVALVSLLNGNEFVHVKLPLIGVSRRFALPVNYTGDVAYHREKWSVFTEYSRGFQGNNFLSGLEYRLGAVELRGAGRISQGSWYPSGGAGFNLTRNFGIDAAVFGTKTFLETHAHVGLAISLRFDKR